VAVKFTRAIVNSGIADPTGLAFLDLNGDKHQDIVAISSGWNNDQMLWHKSNSDGTISTNYGIINSHAVGSRNAIYGTDLDRNGSIDITAAESGDDDINVWYNLYADGSSWAGAEKANSFDGANKVYAADYGYDGYPDIVATAGAQNDLAIWRQLSNGSFTKTDIDTSLSNASAVYGGDIDGDGWQDVIAGGSAGVYWYRNLGNGTSWSKTPITTTLQAEDIKTADFNKDNRLDAVIATSTGIHVWINTGSGGRIITVASLNAKQVAVADIDRDGDDDLVFGSYSTGASLYWYSNNGNETFTSYLIDSGSLNSIYAVATGDADNDGFFDIAIGTHGDDDIYWYRNELRRLSIEAGTPPSEPNTAGYFMFSMDQPSLETIKLSSMYSVYSAAGEATINTDYTISQYVLNAGTAIQYQFIYPINDLYYDPDEQVTFILTGNGLENGYVIDSTKSRATIKIADPNPVVSIGTIKPPSEGGSVGTIEILLNTSSLTSGLRIPYRLEGSYTDMVIYNDPTLSASGILNGEIPVAAGATKTTLYVFANDDNTYESGESATLTLLPETPSNNNIASGSGYRLDKNKNKAVIIIGDNEPIVTLGAVKNSQEGSATGEFIGYVDVELDRVVTKQPGLSVFYSITGGTATQFTDYLNTQGRITTSSEAANIVFIPKGARSARLYLSALPDAIAENTEAITISLVEDQNPNQLPAYAAGKNYAIGEKATATVNIIDSGMYVPSLAILDRLGNAVTTASRLEADANGDAVFGIRLTSQPTHDVRVDVASSTLTFTPFDWDRLQTLTVSGISSTRLLNVTSTSSDPQYNQLSQEMTVIPDDGITKLDVSEGESLLSVVKPSASIVLDANLSEGSELSGGFIILLSNPAPTGGLQINLLVTGTASPSGDYRALPGRITIAAGETRVSLPVIAINDNVMEMEETINVTLQAGDGYSVNADTSTVALRLADDDVAGVSFATMQDTASIFASNEHVDVNVLSFNGSGGTFSVSLKRPPTDVVTVTVQDSLNGSISQQLSFTPQNWSSVQSVNLSNLTPIADVDTSYQLVALTESQDISYQNLSLTYPLTTNRVTTPISTLLTTEGSDENLLIKLTSQPSAEVRLDLGSIDVTENGISTNVLTFTPSNWDQYQSVNVSGLKDDRADGDITYNLLATARSDDGDYESLQAFLTITNADTDSDVVNNEPEADDNLESDPLVTISLQSNRELAESEAAPGTFRITVGQSGSGQPVSVRYSVITDAQAQNASEGVDYQSFNLFAAQAGDQSPFTGIDVGIHSAPALIDLDTDGDLDLVIGTYYGTLDYYENSGNQRQAQFVRKATSPFSSIDLNGNTTAGYSTPTFGDLDGDADQDLILGSNDGTIRFYRNVNLSFTEVTGAGNPFAGIDSGEYSAPSLADIDSDGDLDLFVGTGDGHFRFYRNVGNEATAIYSEDSATNPFKGVDMGDHASIAFANLDADSDLDAVLTGDSNAETSSLNVMQYWLNIGSPSQAQFVQDNSLVERSKITIPDNARPTFADVDADSDQDLLFGRLDGVIDYYANQSSGEITIIPGQYKDINLIPLADAIDETDETVTVILNTNQGYYIDAENTTVSFTIVDDDKAGFLVTDPQGHAVSSAQIYATRESDPSPREFRLRLTSQPTDNVRIYLATSLPGEATLSGEAQSDQSRISLDFTPSNWNVDQSFYVNPKDDRIDDETVAYTIDAIAKSGDDHYNNLQLDSIVLSNQDDDAAGVNITPLTNNPKEGSTNAFQISLNTQPRSDVLVRLTPSNGEICFGNQASSQPLILSFNADNWDLAQTVSVTAIDDARVEYNHTASIGFQFESDDPVYASLSAPEPITVQIQDNDLPIATLSVAQNAAEEAIPGYFTIALNEAADASVGATGLPISYRVLASSTATNGFDYQQVVETGIVRIAPGETSSSLVIAPIDNFVDDGDKQVTIELLAGDGYSLGESITNTLVIINNDKAGVQIIQSGIVPVVKEGEAYSFYVSLLSEPTAETTIHFSDQPSELEAISPLTFQPDNWYQPQSVTIRGRDDNIAETGDNHTTKLAFSFNGAAEYESLDEPVVLDVNVIDRPFDSFNTALGLQYSLESLERAFIESSLPFIGSASKLPLFFDEITQPLVNDVTITNNLTAWKLEQIWRDQLSKTLGDTVSNLQITYQPNDSDTPFTVSFTATYLDQIIPLATDLAIPALSVGMHGNVQADIAYDFTFGYGILKSGGYYLDTARTSLSPRITLDAINLDETDCINGLSIDFQDNGTRFDLDYAITMGPGDLSDDDKVATHQLPALLSKTGQDLFSYFSYNFSEDSEAVLSLSAKPDPAIDDYFPGITFDYYTEDLPLINYADKAKLAAAVFYVNIVNAALDVQSMARGYVKKYVEMIDRILAPFYPMIDTLNADTKFLSALELDFLFDSNNDNKVSVLEVLLTFLNAKDNSGDNDALKNLGIKGFDDGDTLDFYEFIDAINELVEVVRVVDDYLSSPENVLIDIGAVRAKAVSGELELDTVTPINGDILDRIQNNPWATDDLVKLIDKILALDGLEIPLLTDFLTVAKLLTGEENVDFLIYDVPDLDVDLSVDLSDIGLDAILPEYQLDSVLELSVGLNSNLYFAYDDHGLNLWKEEVCEDNTNPAETDKEDDHPKNELLLLEGFYLRDVDESGHDVNELGASFGIDIGLEANAVVARARMTGGVQSDNDVKIDFFDTDEELLASNANSTRDGILRYGEFAPLFSGDLSVLEVSGAIEAFLNTKVEVGVDVGLFEVMETILDVDIATYKIWDAEYALGKIGLKGFASQSPLQAGSVFFDANFNAQIDAGEPVSLSYQDGGFNLPVERIPFDRNRNGRIDSDEGRLVILDAVDTATGLPLETPLFATVDSNMITPLTSLIQKLVQAGLDPVVAANRILQVFGLSAALDLSSYNPSSAITAGDIYGKQVYANHVVAQAAFSVLSQFVAGLTQQTPAEVADHVIGTIARHLYDDEDAGFQNPDFVARLVSTLVHEFGGVFSETQLPEVSAVISRILTVGEQLITSTADKSNLDDAVSKLSPLKIAIQHDLGNILRQLGGGLLSASFVDHSLDHWQARLQESAETSNLEALILALQSLGMHHQAASQQVSAAFVLPDGYDPAAYPASLPADPWLRLQIQTQENQLSLLLQLACQVLQVAGITDPEEASWLISRATAQTSLQETVMDLADADLIRRILDSAALSAQLQLDAAIKASKAERIPALIRTLAQINLETSNPDQAIDQQRQVLTQEFALASPYHQPGPLVVEADQKESIYCPQLIDTQFQITALSVSGSYELGVNTSDGRSIILLQDQPGSDDSALAHSFDALSSQLLMGSESRFFGSLSQAPDGLAAFMDAGMELYLDINGRRYSSLTAEDLDITVKDGRVLGLTFKDTQSTVAEFSISTPVFLTPGLDPTQSTRLEFEIARAASYDNSIGIYRVDDITGAIIVGDRMINPADPDYDRIAVERAQSDGLIFEAPTNMSIAQQHLTLPGASSYGFFLIVDNSVEDYLAQQDDSIQAFFSYSAANHDGSQRFVSLGNGFYGVEDKDDQDFNDVLMKLSFADL
jgi:hypothetical protein